MERIRVRMREVRRKRRMLRLRVYWCAELMSDMVVRAGGRGDSCSLGLVEW